MKNSNKALLPPLIGSRAPVCAINNADDCLNYSGGTFFLRVHLPDINYLFFFFTHFLFIPVFGHDWRLMFASKLPHAPAIYQLPEQSCRFIPTLSGRIFMKLVKKGSNFTHPLMIKKKHLALASHLLCGFFFVHSEEDGRHCGGKNPS